MKERIDVVWPSTRSIQKALPLAPRLPTLAGKTVCGVNNGRYYFTQTWPLVKKLLAEKYPGIKFVDWEKFGIISDKEQEVFKDFAAKLKENRCDAVISGRGC